MDFILAVGRGDTDKVKRLLRDGRYDVNEKSEWGWTPLHIAVRQGDTDMVKLFLDSGAEVNAADSWGKTPLHEAALFGHEDVVKLLLEHGADPNITSEYGWAVYGGHGDIVEIIEKLFLERGAEPNTTNMCGRTPLHMAALYGHEDSVKLLLEHGADPHITAEHKETAYDKAEKKGHEHVKIVLHRYALPPIQAHLLREMIMAISDHVSLKDVRMLARAQLGIPDAKLDNIEYEYQRDAQEQSFQILWLWKERTAGATVHDLFKALKDHQLNACLDKVRDKYASLLNGLWAMPEDEFQKFHSSLQPTKSSKNGVTSPRGKLMYLKCYVSEDLESLEVPLDSFMGNASKDDNGSAGAVLKYGLIWKGICGDADSSPAMAE